MTPPSYLTTFVHEVEDLLERIEAAILALETAPGDAELINQLFRAFHTLKGSAGVAGVASIAGFTHHVPDRDGSRARLLAAFELFEFGVEMMAATLRRRHPGASPEQIERLLEAWLQDRPGAELGDAPGVPVSLHRFR